MGSKGRRGSLPSWALVPVLQTSWTPLKVMFWKLPLQKAKGPETLMLKRRLTAPRMFLKRHVDFAPGPVRLRGRPHLR